MWLRLVLIAVLSLLGWQVVERGMGQMYSERLAAIYAYRTTHWEDAIDSISPDAPYALTSDAWLALADQALARDDSITAQSYLWRALQTNVSSGGGIARFLNINQNNEINSAELDQMALLASQLWPVHEDALLRVAVHWLARGNVEQLLKALDTLFAQTSRYNSTLFPALHTLAQAEQTAPNIMQYAQQAPNWWASFFQYLAQTEDDIALVDKYYQARLTADKPMQKNEHMPYINRLVKEQQWQRAKTVWLKTLTPTHQQLAQDLLYDGSFEGEIHNEAFAWHLSSNTLVTVKTGITGNSIGSKALHIGFKAQKKRIDFAHVWQRLVLPTGDYTLTLHYRLDHFNTAKGLQWRIRCEGNPTHLGESKALKGYTSEWQTLSMTFNIPDSTDDDSTTCKTQILRLESASHYAHDQLYEGGLWFDGIQITPKSP
ncbi:MAG: hypothetical protein L3K52_17985 [Candidatus Thiothrix sulfatifontis]|nr:MAG: hypothetical protein L3K52_17985 [Candidatus Thiothrix sulfatifontis]